MKIIILGGLGYIGSALCEIYRNRPEHSVVVVDRRFVPERIAQMPEHFRFVHADIEDKALMEKLFKDCDLIHFLAAEVEAEASIHKSEAVWKNNFELPKMVMELCGPSTRIMFPSSGNIFGGVDEGKKFLGLTEEDTPAPRLPYAESKFEIEKFLQGSKHNFVILRFTTNYGYSPGVRFNLVTNIFTKRAIMEEDITIHGAGENYRPTACVQDCVRALDFLSQHSDSFREIFHVVRESYKIRDLAKEVINAIDSPSKITFIEKDVPFSAYGLSSAKLRSLGFEFKWDVPSAVRNMKSILSALSPE